MPSFLKVFTGRGKKKPEPEMEISLPTDFQRCSFVPPQPKHTEDVLLTPLLDRRGIHIEHDPEQGKYIGVP